MLCQFSANFPPALAANLDRSVGLRRRFREETATELLLMGLMALAPRGLHVDFKSIDFSADESVDGADMEWIFVAPKEIGGGRFLRLLIQAKVARLQEKRKTPYWYYEHLDYKSGAQAANLMAQAESKADGTGTLPLYMFYHPGEATDAGTAVLPAIQGVNFVFAKDVFPVVGGGCGLRDKKVARWRPKFLPLSALLCWPALSPFRGPSPPGVFAFLRGVIPESAIAAPWAFHPDFVAEKLNTLYRESRARASDLSAEAVAPVVECGIGIPDDIRRALSGEETAQERLERRTSRVIFTTPLTREDPDFERIGMFVRSHNLEPREGRRGR